MKKKSLRDKIYEKTRENIIRGLLAPGERLIEDRLARDFKASRSPVREAMRLLEAEGLITFERNRGITVAKLSIKQVEEIYEIRLLLESHAARVTAVGVTQKGVDYLTGLQDRLKALAENRDIEAWLPVNASFHRFFYDNCGNENLIQIVDNLMNRVNRYHFVTVTVPWQFDMYLDHHEGLLLACKKNDGDLAEKYMRLHLETIKTTLINQLKGRGLVYNNSNALLKSAV